MPPGFPFKINKVDIEIRPLSTSSVVLDEDFREPLTQDIFGDPIKLRGQVNFGDSSHRKEERVAGPTGDMDLSEGHIIFKKRDLDSGGFTPSPGDVITKIASQDFSADKDRLRIIEVRPESPLRGDFLLIYCEFAHDAKLREVPTSRAI